MNGSIINNIEVIKKLINKKKWVRRHHHIETVAAKNVIRNTKFAPYYYNTLARFQVSTSNAS